MITLFWVFLKDRNNILNVALEAWINFYDRLGVF
jgi:hypothetical protein